MTTDTAAPLQRHLFRRFLAWARYVQLERKLAIGFAVAAVVSGIATFAAMTGFPVRADPWVILLLLNLDLVLLLGLGTVIARRLVILWAERRRGLAGAQLHARLVALFSLIAVTPTIVVAVFSALFFNFGLQGWFSDRVSTAVKESLAVAEAYLYEHRRTISADVLAMAQDVNRQGPFLLYNGRRFNQFLDTQAALRSLTEAIVLDDTGRILAHGGYALTLDFVPELPGWAYDQALGGEVVILTSENDDRVSALVSLDSFIDTFLFVARPVDRRVLGHIDRTQGAVRLYETLEGQRSGLQITFALIFVVVALLLLLAAVWVGLIVATNLSRPISGLISAAERVRGGDLTARVDPVAKTDELGSLSRAFNRMTGQLESQQRELLDANRLLDDRRRFTEAVLSGVSAGVVGLDKEGHVTLPNRSACELLSVAPAALKGKELSGFVPEVSDLLKAARRRPRGFSERQVSFTRAGGSTRTLLMRATAELDRKGVIGYVVTFDDITDLLAAQRKAAWSDVARRIAHEIKNPLTPIQLSAERLKRKYLNEIRDDPEIFAICTDTIVRHASVIGRMVDEFSSFARMPAPTMSEENLGDLVDQAVFLQQTAHPEIRITRSLPDHPIIARCDGQQIGRAITNLLQNAVEAVTVHGAVDEERAQPGAVHVRLVDDKRMREIVVEDNGCGLPQRERHRLTEPYVTSREGGTGLGLAIVKKIMEDHGGDLILEDQPGGGARVRLVLPLADDRPVAKAPPKPPEQGKSSAHGA